MANKSIHQLAETLAEDLTDGAEFIVNNSENNTVEATKVTLETLREKIAGGAYTGGEGIDITQNEISFDASKIPGYDATASQVLLNDSGDTKWGEAAESGANNDLSNLSATGKNIGNWSTNITNCIVKIPAAVDLTLSEGSVKLAAGSKVRIPVSAGIYNEVTVASDTYYTSTTEQTYMLFYDTSGRLVGCPVDDCYSGSTAPTGTQIMAWYDTTNNSLKIANDTVSSWVDGYSLPIAVVKASSSGITDIVQTFNGFGYIGNTVFTLPGIVGLIPNGYNADGSLNSAKFETSSVLTINSGYAGHGEVYSITSSAMVVSQYYASQNDKPSTTGTLWYRPKENKVYRVQNDSSVASNNSCVSIETYRDSSGRITKFAPVGVFNAIDHNDILANKGSFAPSKSYIDLTLGASGSLYTAPADGYVVFASNTTATQFLCLGTMIDDTLGLQNDLVNTLVEDRQTGGSTYVLTVSIPVSAGQKFYAAYNVPTNKVYYFRFIYTKASAPEN